MSNKKSDFSGDILSSFEHKAKINPGNKNDDVLLREIEAITEKISLPCGEDEVSPFGGHKNHISDLRDDLPEPGKYDWVSGANDTLGDFVCVTNVVKREGK